MTRAFSSEVAPGSREHGATHHKAGACPRFGAPRTCSRITAVALATVLGLAGAAHAAEFEVQMLNKGAEGPMVFEPAFLKIAPGDTVKFVAKDKGHDVISIDQMRPEGAPAFTGKMNEDLSVTFDKPGVYGYRCLPHYGMGMVGLVVVGEPVNEDKAKAVVHPGRAKTTFAKLFTMLDESKAAAK